MDKIKNVFGKRKKKSVLPNVVQWGGKLLQMESKLDKLDDQLNGMPIISMITSKDENEESKVKEVLPDIFWLIISLLMFGIGVSYNDPEYCKNSVSKCSFLLMLIFI